MTSVATATAAWMFLQSAAAQPQTVGLFVGSNQPGPGQERLQFAVQDAERFRDVMKEIGNVDADPTLLSDPDAAELLAALAAQAEDLQSRADQGAQTVFVFYYSGHARGQALTLGPSELPLQTLRAHLEAMPSTVTIAVLDACQSGAISGVKGVEPAASFSYNSAASLRAEGFAVMASSTGSELSQESEALGGSFFTHHLVAGLRGPADIDEDGAVSLDEAYRYAYDRTLVTTTPTQVGGQHVTLETQLRGRGDMVLTRPSEATAWLVLDGPPGRVLVVRADTGAVVAELVREGSSPLSIAVTAGRYDVVGRSDDGSYRCEVQLADGDRAALSSASCAPVDLDDATMAVKSGDGPFRADRFSIEVGGGGLLSTGDDAYLRRLVAFDYADGVASGTLQRQLTPNATVGVAGRIKGHWSWVVTTGSLESDEWAHVFVQQDSAGFPFASDRFRWWGGRATGSIRYSARLGRSDAWRWMAQAGTGPAMVVSTFDGSIVEAGPSLSLGWHVAAGGGLHWMAPGRGARIGAFGQLDAVWAPVLRNSLNETRNVGGLSATAGLRVAL